MSAGGGWRASAARIGELVKKELLQVFRDSRLVRVIFLAPTIQLIAFGYAVSTDVRDTATLVLDHDRSQTSRELVSSLTASGHFRVVGHAEHPRELVAALDHRTAVVAVEIPAGFAADLAAGRGTSVQLLFDGTNSNLATVARGYAERIVQGFGARTAALAVPASPLELTERAWFNPDLKSRNYNVPAVVGVILMLICLLLTSLAVVREREIGTLEQLLVSPLRPWELLVGKTIPFALLGLLDLAIVTAVALLWFEVPFRGSFTLMMLASVLYLLSALGLGLLVSTLANTQQEAFMSTFLLFMPAMLLSGFLFPVSSMPALFQWLTIANPMRHYLEIVRAVFLKGAGLEALGQQFAALLVLGAVIFGAAVWRFRARAR